MREYNFALSFAGEDREHAEKLVELLKTGGYSVFYDKNERAQLWSNNLYDRLSSIYKDEADHCVMFLSEHYVRTPWTKLERQSAQARVFEGDAEYILRVRLDDTEVEGILPTDGYLDLREMTIEDIYEILVEKLSGTTSQTVITDILTSAAVESHSDVVVIQPILDRIEQRIEFLAQTNRPTLTVTAHPVFPNRPMISTADIYTFATEKERLWNPFRVTGGIYSLSQGNINLPHYWEFNEHGIVYHWVVLDRRQPRRNSDSDKEPLIFVEFVQTIGKLIKKAQSFYEECQYLGNIEATAQLRGVLDEKLMYDESQSHYQMEKQQCTDSEILASTQYLPQDLVKPEKFIEVVDELANPLIWAFNVDDPHSQSMVETILFANKLLEPRPKEEYYV